MPLAAGRGRLVSWLIATLAELPPSALVQSVVRCVLGAAIAVFVRPQWIGVVAILVVAVVGRFI